MLIVILTASILPSLYIHSCSKKICGGINKELSVNILNPAVCCNDASFADFGDNNENLKRKCCHTTIVSQSDTFFKQDSDYTFYNSEFLTGYFIPVVFLSYILNPESKDIHKNSNLQHYLPELTGRKLLSLNCILRI